MILLVCQWDILILDLLFSTLSNEKSVVYKLNPLFAFTVAVALISHNI